MKLMNVFILLLLLSSSNAYAEYLKLNPIHRVVNIKDQGINLTVLPEIEITTTQELLYVNLSLDLDLFDLINKLPVLLEEKIPTWNSRCGKRLIWQLDSSPNGPSLSKKLSFHFELCLNYGIVLSQEFQNFIIGN